MKYILVIDGAPSSMPVDLDTCKWMRAEMLKKTGLDPEDIELKPLISKTIKPSWN